MNKDGTLSHGWGAGRMNTVTHEVDATAKLTDGIYR